VYDKGKIAAVLGVFNGLAIGIQSAFAFGNTAQFQHILAGAAVRLRSDLQVRVTTQVMAASKVMYESLKRTAGPQKPP
jgi:hypothetical protein